MNRALLPLLLFAFGCSTTAASEEDVPIRESVGQRGELEFELDMADAIPVGRVSAALTILRDGSPVEGANVWVTARMPGHTHAESGARAEDVGEGTYEIAELELTMPGEWSLELDAEAADAHDKVTFEILVE